MSLLRGPDRRELTNLVGSEGSQLIELAVILPLLIVIIVGIFDFSRAFNLKQMLGNAALQGARVGSSEPTTDFSQSPPTSVTAIRDVVDTFLKRADIDDCGLSAVTASRASTHLERYRYLHRRFDVYADHPAWLYVPGDRHRSCIPSECSLDTSDD